MKVDFSKGVSIRIAGELGKYNTLPIEALVKIMQNWQWLLQVIAKTHITGEAGIDLNNFKIELSDFTKGSAVPQVQFTKRVNNELFGKIDKQRNIVSDVFENFAKIADKGDYPTLKNMYPSPATRNEIVEALYGFRDSLGESPVAIVETNDNSFETIYTFKKFLPETKKDLITIITNDVNPEFSEKIVLATVKQTTKNSGKTKNKVLQTYLQDNISLSYAPKTIITAEKTYYLHTPLYCLFEEEEGYFVITNEMLDIIGTGESEESAKESFAVEFDYIFTRYNELPENQLSERLLKIKTIINLLVKSVA